MAKKTRRKVRKQVNQIGDYIDLVSHIMTGFLNERYKIKQRVEDQEKEITRID